MISVPSDFRAAKAACELIMSTTFSVISSAAHELSPPQEASPQVTTEPSVLRALKALLEENTLSTPLDNELLTEELSPP